MMWLFIYIFSSLAIFFLLLIALFLIAAYLCLPKISGHTEVSGIEKNIRILRDLYDVPHIIAESTQDAYFGLGYVHAQDRLWQMEVSRKTAAGRMCEVFGRRLLPVDKFMRTIGIHRRVDVIYESLNSETKTLVESYCSGVNAYISSKKHLSFEFLVMRYRPQPWTATDVILVSHLIAWMMNSSFVTKLIRYKLDRSIGHVLARFVMPGLWNSIKSTKGETIVEGGAKNVNNEGASADLLTSQGGGSNAWAVSFLNEEKASSILANDPHVGSSAPCFWHVSHIMCPELNVVGAGIAGIPGILSGRNQKIAWGVTNLNPDVQDLYIEDSEGEISAIDESIEIRGNENITIEVKYTNHGPIINSVIDSVLHNFTCDDVISLRWAAMENEDHTLTGLMDLNKATNWSEFKSSLARFHAPALNFIYSDSSGNIGYKVCGAIPQRKNFQVAAPVDGGDRIFDWERFIDSDQLPECYNPEDNKIISINDYASYCNENINFNHNCLDVFRFDRIRDKLNEKDHFDTESTKNLQLDRYSSQASLLLPKLLALLECDTLEANYAKKILKDWDYYYNHDSVAATIYHIWIWHFSSRFINEIILDSSIANQYFQWRPFVHNVIDRVLSDDSLNPLDESIKNICNSSFYDALKELKSISKYKYSKWAWGRVCKSIFVNQVFAGIPLFKHAFNRESTPVGDWTSINFGGIKINNKFRQTVLPTYRQIIKPYTVDEDLFLLSPGQSGHVASKAYGRFIIRWKCNGYMPLFFSLNSIEKNLSTELILYVKG